MKYIYCIADIHGEFNLLKSLLIEMKKQGFDLTDPNQMLISLGDRVDRGHDSYQVNEFFRTQELMFPGQVISLLGNHERFTLDAAESRSDLMYYNGGYATAKSYMHIVNHTTYCGKSLMARMFPSAFKMSGHYGWSKKLPLYYETDEYFFSHAPIPKEQYRTIAPGIDFRTDEHTLTWSFDSSPENTWIDPNPVPIAEEGNFYGKGKIAVYGHIHGMYSKDGQVVVPGVRKYGNSILLDTGAGCHKNGYISCLRLPDMLVMNSNGKTFNLNDPFDDKKKDE